MFPKSRAFFSIALAAVLVLSAGVPAALAAGGSPSSSLQVNCGAGTFSSIGAAVAAAAPHSTIVVCSGTYNEDVVIPPSKPLVLEGVGSPVINANGLDNGVTVLASGTTVEGFTVENAIGEGILVVGVPGSPITHVTIQGNVVTHNDQGNPTGAVITTSPYRECNGAGLIPGDCGEGIHLMVADYSVVRDNTVYGNSGGVLLTDEFGPTFGNLVAGNDIYSNTLDCGVTLASHNPHAFSGGMPQPTVGGVFDNVVRGNTITGNGVVGQGGGVLMASPLPGGAVYGNVINGNTISGNGLAGVTVHSHAPGQDLNGNVIVNNYIGTNNVAGDFDFYPHVDPMTTGVFVGSVAPLSITIAHNHISNDFYGVWMTSPVSAHGLPSNRFADVTTPFTVG